MALNQGKAIYPDANSTMRITYGNVGGYSSKDAVTYASPVSYTHLDVYKRQDNGQRKADERKIISNVFLKKELKLSDEQYTLLCDMDTEQRLCYPG